MRALAPVQWIGRYTLMVLKDIAEVLALLYGALAVLAFVRTRGFRVVLEVTISQTLFTGVHGLPLVSLAALAMGTLIITQANTYLPVEYSASVAAHIIARDVIPLAVGVILLGRSGTAICVELAGMKLNGELEALHSMGIPLEHYIVLPRLVAGIVSAVTLTVYALTVAFAVGFTVSKAVASLPFALEGLLSAVDERDLLQAFAKAVLFGAGIVLVSIHEGYSVQRSTREIPQATTRAVVRSMGLVLVLNTLISISF